jgi:anti-sigma factor RsiW
VGDVLTCREIADFLADYLSGELPVDQAARFERHLALCPACVDYIRSYKDTIRFSRAAFDEMTTEESTNVPEDLVQAILAARRRI